MNIELAEKIANAVLYEGYMLYPYRPSSVKNRQRWTFGGIYPPAHAGFHGGSDRCFIQTECLVVGGSGLEIRVRFLHLLDRLVGKVDTLAFPGSDDDDLPLTIVESLQVRDRSYRPWQEAVERDLNAPPLCPGEAGSYRREFSFPAQRALERIYNDDREVVGAIVREQQPLLGAIEIDIEPIAVELSKVTLRILNLTPFKDAPTRSRDDALLQSLVSAHAILSVREGEFISLLDPPATYRGLASNCRNEGVYPVFVGEEGQRDMMLASPIILYDHPQIAPESPGDLFDGTEIDEILTLRILTMTDEEKREARQSDEKARALLDRTESLPWKELTKLHGMMRQIRSSDAGLGGDAR